MLVKQNEVVKKKNEDFFLTNLDSYRALVADLDTYQNIFNVVNESVRGINNLVDIGNGGVFAYDPKLVNKITAIDLFLDNLDQSKYPPNVILKQGNALNLSESTNSFDGTLMVMLIHHLVGDDLSKTEKNMQKCFEECHRVLKPGGKLILVESCVPYWLYLLERLLFPVTNFLISTFLNHPMAFQYTSGRIHKTITSLFGNCGMTEIPKGKYVIQLGWKTPSFLTPVRPMLFIAEKKA